MTAMTIRHEGIAYLLTDDGGEAVLIAAAGAKLRGGDVVAILPAEGDEIFGLPERPLLARDVANLGTHEATEGEAFRAPDPALDGYEALTPYGHATADLFARFMQQSH